MRPVANLLEAVMAKRLNDRVAFYRYWQSTNDKGAVELFLASYLESQRHKDAANLIKLATVRKARNK